MCGKYSLLQSLQISFSLCYARKLLPFLRPKVVAISARNTIMRKFANFVRLYFPHIKTFFNQILGFYYFWKVFFGNVVLLVGICLEQKFVYKGNCLLYTNLIIQTFVHNIEISLSRCTVIVRPPSSEISCIYIVRAWRAWLNEVLIPTYTHTRMDTYTTKNYHLFKVVE